MAGTEFYYMDSTERRYQLGHMGGYLTNVLTALKDNPSTLDELSQSYETTAGETLFDPGNVPRIPEDLTIEAIRQVFGDYKRSDEELIKRWEEFSCYRKPDFETLSPDEKLPSFEIDDDLRAEWESEDPDKEDYSTIEDYNKTQAPGDGIVIVDLSTRTLQYLSNHFDIKEKDLPSDWTLEQL